MGKIYRQDEGIDDRRDEFEEWCAQRIPPVSPKSKWAADRWEGWCAAILATSAPRMIAAPAEASELMNTDQAAQFLHIQPQTLVVWRSNNRKKLAFVKIGGQVRYRRKDLDKFIADGLRNAA